MTMRWVSYPSESETSPLKFVANSRSVRAVVEAGAVTKFSDTDNGSAGTRLKRHLESCPVAGSDAVTQNGELSAKVYVHNNEWSQIITDRQSSIAVESTSFDPVVDEVFSCRSATHQLASVCSSASWNVRVGAGNLTQHTVSLDDWKAQLADHVWGTGNSDAKRASLNTAKVVAYGLDLHKMQVVFISSKTTDGAGGCNLKGDIVLAWSKMFLSLVLIYLHLRSTQQNWSTWLLFRLLTLMGTKLMTEQTAQTTHMGSDGFSELQYVDTVCAALSRIQELTSLHHKFNAKVDIGAETTAQACNPRWDENRRLQHVLRKAVQQKGLSTACVRRYAAVAQID